MLVSVVSLPHWHLVHGDVQLEMVGVDVVVTVEPSSLGIACEAELLLAELATVVELLSTPSLLILSLFVVSIFCAFVEVVGDKDVDGAYFNSIPR